MAELLFKQGLYKDLPSQKTEGVVYFTKDEGGMYIDAKVNGELQRVRVQGSVLYFDDLASFTETITPPYSPDVLYFIAKSTTDGVTKTWNALFRWDPNYDNGAGKTPGKFIQLNVTKDAFDNLITEMGKLDDRIEKSEAFLGDYTGTFASYQETVNNTFTSVNTAISNVDGKATANAGNIAKNTENIAKNAEAISDVSTKADANEQALNELKNTTIPGITSDIEDNANAIQTLNNWKTTQEPIISGLNTTVNDPTTGLVKKVDDVTGRVDALELSVGSFTPLSDDVNDISKAINYLNEERKKQAKLISDHDTTISEHTTELGNQDVRISAVEEALGLSDGTEGGSSFAQQLIDLTNRMDAVDGVDGRLDTIDDNIDTLQSQVSNLDAAYKAADSQIRTDFAAADNEIKGLINTEKGRIDNLEDRVDVLETNSATKDELNQAKSELQTELENQINAANAMRFIDDPISSKADYDALLLNDELSIGDTYVVADNFTVGDNVYHAGDLLVAAGEEDENGHITLATLNFTWVKTGYGSAHNLELALGGTDTPLISLQDKMNDVFGTVQFKGFGNVQVAVSTSAAAPQIDVKMVWDTFGEG